jgi:hypothetical protein
MASTLIVLFLYGVVETIMGSYMKMHMKAHKAQVRVEGLVFVLKTKKMFITAPK